MTKRDKGDGPTQDMDDAERDGLGSPVRDDAHWRQVARRLYEPSRDGDLTAEIVYTIAEAKGVDPTALKSPTLYDVVDVAAIEDAFFGIKGKSDAGGRRARFEFRYTAFLVEVRSDGWVRVFEPTETESS